MSSPRQPLVLLGAACWVAFAALGSWLVGPWLSGSGDSPPIARRILGFAWAPERTVELTLPGVPARHGDPIFLATPEGEWLQAGFLSEVDDRRQARAASASWYEQRFAPEECEFYYHKTRGTLAEVLETMLPAHKRADLVRVISAANQEHAPAITAALRPIVERALAESAPVIEAGLAVAIAAHRGELEALGARYEETFFRQRLLPLIREEVMPSVRAHGEPLAKEIGNELWDRASVWRFGWRAVYDKMPLPERDLTNKEFERFIDNDAVPVFEARIDDLVEVLRKIFSEALANKRIRDELRGVGLELIADVELQRVLKEITQEAIVENEALREVWVRNWQAEEAREAVRLTGERLEPVVRKIGDELFGTREGGINPDFARVLRNQILGKDRRWLVARPTGSSRADSGPIAVQPAPDFMPFPLVVTASQQP